MPKECIDCSSGQCEDRVYEVLFETKTSYQRYPNYFEITHRFWYTYAYGKVGGLSLKKSTDIFFDANPLENEQILVLTVNEGDYPLLEATGRFYDSNRTYSAEKESQQRYQGSQMEPQYYITSVKLREGSAFNKNKIKCKCTNGDEKVDCPTATGGICCISKNLIDRFCAKG